MLLATALAAAAAAVTLPPLPEMRAQIAARDAELFTTLFGLDCAPERMRALLADDLEFYHDKDGLVQGADRFVADFQRFCAERQKPGAWRSRREPDVSTMTIDPIPGVGALHAGTHFFYERQGEGPEKKVGRASFANLWRLTPSGWRLARVFSYGHGPAR
jgi:hypothetical protein